MKTLKYGKISVKEIEVGELYLFGQLFDGIGDEKDFYKRRGISVYDEVFREFNIVYFEEVNKKENVLESIVRVTDILRKERGQIK